MYFAFNCTLLFPFSNPLNDIFPHFESQLEVIALPRQWICDNDLWQTFGWTDWQASMKSNQRSKSSLTLSLLAQVSKLEEETVRHCACAYGCMCFLVFVWVCIAWVGWAGSRWTGSGCGLAAKTLPDSNERQQQQWVRKREKGTGAAYALDVIYSLLIIVSSRTCANTFRSFHSACCCCCCAKASG